MTAVNFLARTLVAPRKFTAVMPSGCLEDPRRHSARIEQCGDTPDEIARLAFALAEVELSDVAGHDVLERQKAGGRSDGPRFAMKVAVGLPGSAQPRCSRITAAWRSVAKWLQVMVVHWDREEGANGRPLARHAKWKVLHTDWDCLGQSSHARALCSWTAAVHEGMLNDRDTVVFLMRAVMKVS